MVVMGYSPVPVETIYQIFVTGARKYRTIQCGVCDQIFRRAIFRSENHEEEIINFLKPRISLIYPVR